MNETLCCADCGLMMQADTSAREIHCPRCDSCVKKQSYSIDFSLGLAIAALIMFAPAMYFPILTFELGNSEQVNTMLSGLYYFVQDGYPQLSIVVFFTSILAPFIQIVFSILLYLPLVQKRKPKYMKFYFKVLHHIRHWVMLDVYIIAILVSYIKLRSISELIYGPGLTMFVFLMIFSFMLSYSFSPKKIWKAYHDAQ